MKSARTSVTASLSSWQLQLHTGSPWVQSRPVFVLVQQQPDGNTPVTYTLKTKVSWTAAEDELAKVGAG